MHYITKSNALLRKEEGRNVFNTTQTALKTAKRFSIVVLQTYIYNQGHNKWPTASMHLKMSTQPQLWWFGHYYLSLIVA